MNAKTVSLLLRLGMTFGLAVVMLVLENAGLIAPWPLWAVIPVACMASIGPQLDILRQDNERIRDQ